VAPPEAGPGTTVRVSVVGVAPARSGLLNEYGALRYVASVADRTSPAADLPGPASPFSVRVPTATRPGNYVVRVSGVMDGRVVSWSRAIVVKRQAASPTVPQTASVPTPSVSAFTPTTSPSPSTAITQSPAPTSRPVAAAPTGSRRWYTVVGLLLAAATASAVWFTHRRQSRRLR
jgi:hypothetical protein